MGGETAAAPAGTGTGTKSAVSGAAAASAAGQALYLDEKAESVGDLVKRIQAAGAKGLLKEFHRLKSQCSKMDGRTDDASKAAANVKKNRYKDVGCWDQTRVKLEPVEGGSEGDYIHANWVEGVEQPRRYILTQGPMLSIPGYADTTADMWRMVWEQGVSVIIMLCQVVEQDKSKCAQYWPTTKGAAQIHGNFSVFCKEAGDRHIADHTIVLSNLILTPINGGEGRREICHYLHSNWPDRKCPPSAAPIVDFLVKVNKAARTLAERQGLSQTKSPLLVHCSAGIGRTGTLVAIDIGMGLLSLPSPRLSLPHIVLQLRRQRKFSVQTPIQYLCIYQALLEFLLRNKTITNFNIAHFNREITALA